MSDFLSLTLVAISWSQESCATSELRLVVFSAHQDSAVLIVTAQYAIAVLWWHVKSWEIFLFGWLGFFFLVCSDMLEIDFKSLENHFYRLWNICGCSSNELFLPKLIFRLKIRLKSHLRNSENQELSSKVIFSCAPLSVILETLSSTLHFLEKKSPYFGAHSFTSRVSIGTQSHGIWNDLDSLKPVPLFWSWLEARNHWWPYSKGFSFYCKCMDNLWNTFEFRYGLALMFLGALISAFVSTLFWWLCMKILSWWLRQTISLSWSEVQKSWMERKYNLYWQCSFLFLSIKEGRESDNL